MLTRIAAAIVVGVLLIALSPASAQPPTDPATIDVTCHGYDEGATRAYNCIPVASQQHLLATFVPPVGSACNGGQVAEFPPGRIVFQIRCDDAEGGTGPPTTTPPTTPTADFEIFNVTRYPTSIDVSDWLQFSWRANVTAARFEVSVRFQQGAYHTTCTERFYNPMAGLQENETSIPSVCGVDQQWSSVTIAATTGTCAGCGTFTRTTLSNSRSLDPGSADPNEVNAFIEEVTFRAQMGATGR